MIEANNDYMKEVDFEKYCKTCKNNKLKEEETPCYECLSIPARPYSHKPERYEEK